MSKIIYGVSTLALSFCCVAVLNAAPELPGTACSITCYEKTPSCYVSKDKSGCLVISNEKPSCSKGSCICELKACAKKSSY